LTSDSPLPLEVRIDRDECIGAQNCVRWAPRLFQIDDEGLAEVLPAGLGTTPLDDILKAANDCPTNAVIVIRDGVRIA
jgi:ferredoxin